MTESSSQSKTFSEEWCERVMTVVDGAHKENLGGKHRSGFCEACADAHLVAQRAVPDDELLRAALREVVRRAEGGLLNAEWVALPAKDALDV